MATLETLRDRAAEKIALACADGGLDLHARGRRSTYDDSVSSAHRFDAPAGLDALLVIGNTARLWTPFTTWLRREPARTKLDDPLDTYVAEVVERAMAVGGGGAHVTWIHVRARPVLSAARLCEATGLAAESPSRLAAHPRFGPWFALRAAVLLEGPGWPDGAQGGDERISSRPPSPCGGCPAPCEAALERVVADTRVVECQDVAARWRDWVAVRDACPVGRNYRYGPAQLRYHYTGDRALLEQASRAREP